MLVKKEQPTSAAVYFSKEQAVLLPNNWQGEANCMVGPFSSHTIANYFTNKVTTLGYPDVFSLRIFPKREAWYVEVQKLG